MSAFLAHGLHLYGLHFICSRRGGLVRWVDVLPPGDIVKEDIPCLHYTVKRLILNLEPGHQKAGLR